MILLLLLACGVPSTPGDRVSDPVFPHPDDFAHGAAWRADSATCITCHAPLGETPSAGPSCTSCHEAYPHGPDMADGAVHGHAGRAEPGSCATCHADDGPEAVPSCTSCHATYPHGEGFAHGAAVRARGGAEACAGCHDGEVHGDTAPDGLAAPPTCGTCHDAYPHPDGWAHPDAHGQATCGQACHGTPQAPPPEGTPTCGSCHDVYPHPGSWVAFDHLRVVQVRGEAGCTGCHPSGTLSGPRIPHSCSTGCHGSPP